MFGKGIRLVQGWLLEKAKKNTCKSYYEYQNWESVYILNTIKVFEAFLITILPKMVPLLPRI